MRFHRVHSTATPPAAALALLTASLAGCAGGQAGPSNSPGRPEVRGAAPPAAGRAPAPTPRARPAELPAVGRPETVATDDGPMWTGVTVSRTGRIFVCYPRWGDAVEFTVAEVKGGRAVAYPDADVNRIDPGRMGEQLVSVQSVVAGPDDRLWALDTGSVRMREPPAGAAKLVGIDLNTDKVVETIALPPTVALPTTYLNDVRFNPRQGKAGLAFITDSGDQGPNGLIVVDLDSRESWRRLTGHPSVRAEKGFVATVEGRPLLKRPEPGVARPMTSGADGIALGPDGRTLFYSPLCGRHLYGVSTEALADRSLSDDDVARTIVDYGDRGYASDGLECDGQGRLYLTDYEHNAVHRRSFGPGGPADVTDKILVRGPNLLWPDTLSLSADGWLYFTANQLSRQKQFNEGTDLREKPYLLLRVPLP